MLVDTFNDLRSRMKASREEDSEVTFSRDDDRRLRVLKRVKDHDVWPGGNRPSYGPALSSKISATREVVLQRRPSDGKICVSQRSDTASDVGLRTFANNAQGYTKALDYYLTMI